MSQQGRPSRKKLSIEYDVFLILDVNLLCPRGLSLRVYPDLRHSHSLPSTRKQEDILSLFLLAPTQALKKTEIYDGVGGKRGKTLRALRRLVAKGHLVLDGDKIRLSVALQNNPHLPAGIFHLSYVLISF